MAYLCDILIVESMIYCYIESHINVNLSICVSNLYEKLCPSIGDDISIVVGRDHMCARHW